MRTPINTETHVKRWDVYDAADHLDDYMPAFYQAFERKDWNSVLQLAENLQDWVDKLWAMSVRGGDVGPAPFYVNEVSSL